MTHPNIQRASQSRKQATDRADDLLGTVCARLGLTPEDAASIDAGQYFVSPSGLACRLRKDELEPQSALRAELELPLLLEDLEPPQLAALLDIQTVLVSTMGWAISADPELGQLRLSPLLASTLASTVVDDLSSGSVLVLSVLQMLLTGAAVTPTDPSDLRADAAPGSPP
jgi:hypothetical protein